MTARFDAVDLSKLPPPAALEKLSFEAILDARMQDFLVRWNAAPFGIIVSYRFGFRHAAIVNYNYLCSGLCRMQNCGGAERQRQSGKELH